MSLEIDEHNCIVQNDKKIHQGDILSGIPLYGVDYPEEEFHLILDRVAFKATTNIKFSDYCVVLSQECDLEQDRKFRDKHPGKLASLEKIDQQFNKIIMSESVKTVKENIDLSNAGLSDENNLDVIYEELNQFLSREIPNFLEAGNDKKNEFIQRVKNYPNLTRKSKKILLLVDLFDELYHFLNKDKFIPNILVCPAYNVKQFLDGNHLGETNIMRRVSKSEIASNSRYYQISMKSKNDELVIDFKHFFSISRNTLAKFYQVDGFYQARLKDLFKEDLSQRFSNYLCRIGLPVKTR